MFMNVTTLVQMTKGVCVCVCVWHLQCLLYENLFIVYVPSGGGETKKDQKNSVQNSPGILG